MIWIINVQYIQLKLKKKQEKKKKDIVLDNRQCKRTRKEKKDIVLDDWQRKKKREKGEKVSFSTIDNVRKNHRFVMICQQSPSIFKKRV
jgi:hypothetical protein